MFLKLEEMLTKSLKAEQGKGVVSTFVKHYWKEEPVLRSKNKKQKIDQVVAGVRSVALVVSEYSTAESVATVRNRL